jgi:ABC-type multidrug transport system fused ATPase/permease subunit
VRDADLIVVLEPEGAVETTGTHDELLAREGWYRTTWEQQQRTESLSAEVESEIGRAS